MIKIVPDTGYQFPVVRLFVAPHCTVASEAELRVAFGMTLPLNDPPLSAGPKGWEAARSMCFNLRQRLLEEGAHEDEIMIVTSDRLRAMQTMGALQEYLESTYGMMGRPLCRLREWGVCGSVQRAETGDPRAREDGFIEYGEPSTHGDWHDVTKMAVIETVGMARAYGMALGRDVVYVAVGSHRPNSAALKRLCEVGDIRPEEGGLTQAAVDPNLYPWCEYVVSETGELSLVPK